jgi:transcription antitermination factor NusB
VQREHHPNAQSREWALQFLYQCEIEKLYFYSANHFDRFVSDFKVDKANVLFFRSLVEGIFEKFSLLNEKIESVSEHWTLSRMPVIDRCLLRLAAYELFYSEMPKKVIINEAIELAKKYSTENSGAFVNGILDKLAHQTRN